MNVVNCIKEQFYINNLGLTGKLKESFYTGENQLAHDTRI